MKSDILADVKMFYRSRMDFNLILAVLIAVLAIMVSIGCIDRSPILILILSVGYLLWTCVSSLVYYIKIVKSIKERCPTETDQIELAHDFRESVSVYLDRMRIGKNYTFMATEKGFWIVDTQKIVGFSQEHIEGRTPTTAIYIDLDSDAPTRRLFVTRIGDLPEISVGEQIQKAKSVLRQMHGEQGED